MGIPLPALNIRPPAPPQEALFSAGNSRLQHFQPPSRLHSFRPERFDEKSVV
jgi:hypothetical protein